MRATGGSAAITVRDVTKVYGRGEGSVRALDGVSIEFQEHAFTAIMGASGSGKSTLMQCCAGLDSVTSGEIDLAGHRVSHMNDDEVTKLRRSHMGFVFQSFNLLPAFNALQNIEMPLTIAGHRPDRPWIDMLVDTLGLRERLSHLPSELSGGQQQRVAIARALAAHPKVVFCDEPTGALDSTAGQHVLRFLRRSVDELGSTILMVTHDPTSASYADRVVYLADGQIVGEDNSPSADRVLQAIRSLGARA